MGRRGIPRVHAHWMLVTVEGVPVYYGTRWSAIEAARHRKATAYRQDVPTGRLDIVYDPATDVEYQPGARIVADNAHQYR